MAFLIYFFVLLVSAASVLFGLDLMTSPLPKTPNVPIGRSVQVTAQSQEQQEQQRKKAADERALTPVYRATPNVLAETSGAAPQQDAKAPPAEQAAPAQAPSTPTPPAASVAQNAAPPTPAPAAPVAPPAPAVAQNSQPAPAAAAPPPPTNVAQSSQPTPVATTAVTQAPAANQQAKADLSATEPPARTEAKVEAVAATQPAQQASKTCNVQACSAAYQSFRASDCSYQPHEGARRVCSTTGAGAATARAAKPDKSEQTARRSSAPDELREVEREVKRQPLELRPSGRAGASSDRGEMREVERIVRHMTRGENADIPVEDADGQVFIVRKGYR